MTSSVLADLMPGSTAVFTPGMVGWFRVGRFVPPLALNQSNRICSACCELRYGPAPSFTLGPW